MVGDRFLVRRDDDYFSAQVSNELFGNMSRVLIEYEVILYLCVVNVLVVAEYCGFDSTVTSFAYDVSYSDW